VRRFKEGILSELVLANNCWWRIGFLFLSCVYHTTVLGQKVFFPFLRKVQARTSNRDRRELGITADMDLELILS